MLERLQKAGKPITPQMQKMADTLDSMDTGSDGQVGMCMHAIIGPAFISSEAHHYELCDLTPSS